jgi:drug/metabolite transporter (DMT)-like permease
MKTTNRMFLWLMVFLAPDTVIYWYLSKDPTGTAALTLCTLMSALIWYYLAFTSRRIGPGPEDDEEAEISDGAGELGFFSPYSWWPLGLVLSIGTGFLGIAVGWWLVYFAIPLVAVSVVGMIFEYYLKESNRYGD